MNFENTTNEFGQRSKLATNVCFVDHTNGFKDIHRHGVGAVVMRRQFMPGFQHWIDGLASPNLPSLRSIVAVEKSAETINAAFNAARTPAGDNRDYLINDAVALSESFAALLKVSHIRIRLDVVNDNACCLFHVDQVSARLICTYRGRGTQYGLWRPDSDPKKVHEVATGSPIVIRGTSWDNDVPSGLVHRSPPIEGSGKTRLLLVLDPIKDIISG